MLKEERGGEEIPLPPRGGAVHGAVTSSSATRWPSGKLHKTQLFRLNYRAGSLFLSRNMSVLLILMIKSIVNVSYITA